MKGTDDIPVVVSVVCRVKLTDKIAIKRFIIQFQTATCHVGELFAPLLVRTDLAVIVKGFQVELADMEFMLT